MAQLDHVNVVVSDPERSIAFYSRLLGLSVVMDRMLDGLWFEEVTGLAGARARCVIMDAPNKGCRIELLAFEAASGTAIPANALPPTLGLRHFAVRVDNIEACLSTLPEPPLIIAVPRNIVPVGKRMAYVRDPDGAIVELAEYGGTPSFT
ncbi:MAG TPA: VOC family protein [Magnetospirillum sp.]|nr:VOC family protein [Magnetospirillum sp.]